MAGVAGRSGPKQEKPWRDAIHRAVKRTAEDKKTKRLDQLANSLVAAGIEGDVSALKEIGDRLDGKPTQQVDHGLPSGGNVKFVMTIGSDD